MAKDSVYSLLQKPVTEHGRNVFPLDNRQIYSMKAGQITPVKAIHFKPGDYFDMQAHDFSITFPMNTAAFLRGRKETAFYSVYYNAIWSLYNQYQASRSEPKTSAFDANGRLVEPRIKLYDLLYNIWGQWNKYIYYEYYLPYYYDCTPASPSLESLRNSWMNALSSWSCLDLSTSENVATIASTYINSVANNYYQGELFTRGQFQYLDGSSSVRMRGYVCDIVGHFRAYSWLRKLDMLGYGNYYPLFSAAESEIVNLTAPTDTSSLAVWLEDACKSMIDLLMSLADSCWQYTGTPLQMTSIFVEKQYNLYPICAYNSIFYHFFRNSFYDNDYYSHNFSLDFVSTSNSFGTFNVVNPSHFDLRFLDIEYHQWKKDRFTGVLPDQQFGAVGSISFDAQYAVVSNDKGHWNFDSSASDGDPLIASVPGKSIYTKGSSGINYEAFHDHTVTIPPSSFDVIALKRAEMLQEYRQLLMRAGNKTTDIFRAIYGEACSSEHVDDIIPRFMDTFGEDIFVDPVTATAETGASQNGTLGDLSARGKFSGSSGRVKFNAGGNFGVILALTYVVPTSEYNSYIVDRHVMELTPEDHFIPQFENLGLQDIYNFELNCLLPYNNTRSLGKAPRYFHKKTEVDLVHGAFCSLARNLQSGNNPLYWILNSQYGGWFGQFNHWVSPRTDLQGRLSTSIRDFYVNPSVLDNVFVQAAGADISQDQFICNTYFEIRSTKEMSKTGLPNFV